jgi:hypothetical protein
MDLDGLWSEPESNLRLPESRQRANMVDYTKINAALETYSDWTQPWGFWDSCVSYPGLSDEELVLLRSAWDETNSTEIWFQPGDLPELARMAAEKVRIKLPWVSLKASHALARAAAFNWR